MTAQLSKDSIDIGIVTTNAPECLAFYRDVLGFEDAGESPVPRWQCRASVVMTAPAMSMVSRRFVSISTPCVHHSRCTIEPENCNERFF